MTGTARIIHGNALDLPLPDESVDLVVTSPPYFGLRSYQDGGRHYDGQIGAEATPAEFVDALIAATAEMARVLKPTGSIWVNLGDKYSGYNVNGAAGRSLAGERVQRVQVGRNPDAYGIPNKSLIGIPWRYAIRAIDDLGLILRAEVIWAKPNGLPESVTDRVRRSHETWFHFTKSPRYFSAVDEVREPHTMTPQRRLTGSKQVGAYEGQNKQTLDGPTGRFTRSEPATDGNPLGKLPGSVWSIPTQPLRVPAELGIDHFAAFPMEWPRRIIRGWSPTAGVCTACGEGRRPVASVAKTYAPRPGRVTALTDAHGQDGREGARPSSVATITGYACACTPWHTEPAPTDRDPDNETTVYDWHLWDAPPTTPAVILDPFGGTGTTALVAKALGRTGITVDLSHDYCRLATWRTNDRDQLAAAMQVDKPANKPLEGQLGLFGDDAA